MSGEDTGQESSAAKDSLKAERLYMEIVVQEQTNCKNKSL
jgi:hypothetical protein